MTQAVKSGAIWAGDLGCLIGPDYVKKIDFEKAFLWLERMSEYGKNCIFIAGGDVVCDAKSTLETYEEFEHYFDGWPLAYVAQNGAENLPIPATASAVFIGGDTDWKCSMAAVAVIKRAQAKELHVHIGRVNHKKRYDAFRILSGSENFTCDGTRVRFERDKALRDWRNYERQIPINGGLI